MARTRPHNCARPLPADDPAFDSVIDGAGPTIHFTWRSYGELLRLLDRAAEAEAEYGWSIWRLQDMTEFLQESARSRAMHPSNKETP